MCTTNRTTEGPRWYTRPFTPRPTSLLPDKTKIVMRKNENTWGGPEERNSNKINLFTCSYTQSLHTLTFVIREDYYTYYTKNNSIITVV